VQDSEVQAIVEKSSKEV